jgi:predicted ATPase/DNA-binding CsgD family transcriptional regulator
MLAPRPVPQTLRLQIPHTPLIGRERQVADVCALLGRPAVRLITLTGPGGIGKTRLVLAIAEALRSDYADSVYYVSLASLTDASLVLPAIAESLGLREIGAAARQAFLLQHLQQLIGQQKLLLVLDNFEQVIEAAADIAALLSACDHLNVLVTSREILRISAEHAYLVPPLTLPDLQHLPPIEILAQVEAVRLFITRAQASEPGFSLILSNAGAVAAICHHLDGLPLAIELAAARVRLLSPSAMLERLEKKLPWLSSGSRDAPSRHQTLRAAINWSYDLLEPDEQELFRRMAVFVGGCTLDAVEAVCAASELPASFIPQSAIRIPQYVDVLASLVDKSLLRQGHTGDEQGRLYMLETIREYALEQLAASGEAEDTRRAHAHYYVALAEEAEPKMTGAEQPVWLARLEQEHDNLRAALAWAVEGGDAVIGARLAAALWRFWLTHGHLSEGQRWIDAALARDGSLPAELRARALNGAGRLAVRQGEYASAQAMLEESLALWRSLSDTKGEMQALNSLGLVAIYRSDFTRAQGYFEQNLEGWRSLGDTLGMCQALNNLGLALRYQEEFERAEKVYEECLALARVLQDYFGVGAALHNLGQMLHHKGDDARAHRLLVESLVFVRQIGDTPSISVGLMDLAGVCAAQGQPERAARLFGAAEALREKTRATMYEGQRLAYERDVARGKAQLDAATWEAAWAEGRAMSLDDAYALALEELPSSPETETPSPSPRRTTYNLTERELEVLRLLVAGLTYGEIAAQLILSFHTVHAHVRSIYAKLGVTSRSQATRFAKEHNLA